MLAQVVELLSKTIADAAVLEVRTYTADPDEALADDPTDSNARLRAFTRVALDGDTRTCIPVLATGAPDETLWKLHCAAVDQARADRAASINITLGALRELAGR